MKFDSEIKMISFASFAGIVGYFGSAMVNDTILSVTTVFWILLGMGVAANNLIIQEKSATISSLAQQPANHKKEKQPVSNEKVAPIETANNVQQTKNNKTNKKKKKR